MNILNNCGPRIFFCKNCGPRAIFLEKLTCELQKAASADPCINLLDHLNELLLFSIKFSIMKKSFWKVLTALVWDVGNEEKLRKCVKNIISTVYKDKVIIFSKYNSKITFWLYCFIEKSLFTVLRKRKNNILQSYE